MFKKGIDADLKKSLDEYVISHRNQGRKLISHRYKELLPFCISYEQAESVSVDFLKVELGLRYDLLPVIGENINGDIVLLGKVNSIQTYSEPDNWYTQNILTGKEIQFIIPEELRLPIDQYREITTLDNASSGNFVVMRNKIRQHITDLEIIEYYADELAEIIASKFSLYIQAKFMTIFACEPNDETINQFISSLWNGNPFVRMNIDGDFDPEENIIKIENPHLHYNIEALRNAYQNTMSDLNSFLGINSLAVDKASGVSDVEASSNKPFVQANENIYIKTRQSCLDLLNKRYNKDLKAIYDETAVKELERSVSYDNINPNGNNPVGTD